jgi:hypothetical protein
LIMPFRRPNPFHLARGRCTVRVMLFFAAIVVAALWRHGTALAQTPSQAGAVAAEAAPIAGTLDLATRVADLEADATNGAPKVLSSPGPGHNGGERISGKMR